MPDTILTDEFKKDEWQRFHVLWKAAVDPNDYINTQEIEQQLEASLLRWPYFTLLKDGQQPSVATYTQTRNVIGQQRAGFPDQAAIAKAMSEGASLKLNQVGDWHRGTHRLRESLEAGFPAAVSSYVFWTPQAQRGMLPHRDAAHVLAIQLEGRKAWELYANDEQVKDSAGLDVDSGKPTHTFVMEPGDVLYLPHGWPHAARAIDGASMHLTFTIAEPTDAELTETLIGIFAEKHPDLVDGFHRLPLVERTRAVIDALTDDIREISDDEWLRAALVETRKEVG